MAKDHQQIKSIRQLAPLVDRKPSTVRKWVNDSRWPFAKSAPWPMSLLPDIKVWAKITLTHDPAKDYHDRVKNLTPGVERPPSKIEQAKLFYMVERAQWIKQKRQVEAGELHNVKECDQRKLRQIHEVKGRLMELPRSMATSLVGQDAETIERLLRDQVMAILNEFAGGDDKAVKTDDE